MAYQISGRVIRGDGYGKALGFPTANLERRQWARLKRKPKLGVWAGYIKLKMKNEKLKVCPVGIVIGPYDKHHLPKIEAHLIGFKGNLYGRILTLHLYQYLRPFRKFRSAKQLKQQISKDISFIKKLKFN